MLAGPADVVEHRQQLGERRRDRRLADHARGRARPGVGSWRTRPAAAAGPTVRSASSASSSVGVGAGPGGSVRGLRSRRPSPGPPPVPTPGPGAASATGSRTSSVSGSMRRRSRKTGAPPTGSVTASRCRSSPRRRSRRPRSRRRRCRLVVDRAAGPGRPVAEARRASASCALAYIAAPELLAGRRDLLGGRSRIASTSSPSSAFFRSAERPSSTSVCARRSGTLSALSARNFSVW